MRRQPPFRAREDNYEVITHIAGSKPEKHRVSSLAAASSVARKAIDDAGAGASDMGRQHGTLKRNGRVIGRVAYNGRIFDLDNKIMWDNRAPQEMRAGRPFHIPGWSVGYSDEIGANAATREAIGENMLFVMTADDREPRSLDEEVTVGLYFFDGENWEQIAYQDYPSVTDVIRRKDAELQLSVEHGMSVNECRRILIDELRDWENGFDDPGVEGEETPGWAEPIFQDSGVLPENSSVDEAVAEAVEQVQNASPAQILEYMTARAEEIEA